MNDRLWTTRVVETARPLRIPRRKIEPRSRRNRFAPLPPEGQSIAPVCVQASRESRFHDAIEIARAFVSPIFFTFFSPLLLSFTRSSPYPENIRCEASGTGRCEIAITRFDELGGNPPFDEFAPYLPAYQLPLSSTRLITSSFCSVPGIAN